MQSEREFIHDMLSPLMVIQGRIKMILKKMDKDPNAMDMEKLNVDLNKVLTASDKLNDIIQTRRSALKSESSS